MINRLLFLILLLGADVAQGQTPFVLQVGVGPHLSLSPDVLTKAYQTGPSIKLAFGLGFADDFWAFVEGEYSRLALNNDYYLREIAGLDPETVSLSGGALTGGGVGLGLGFKYPVRGKITPYIRFGSGFYFANVGKITGVEGEVSRSIASFDRPSIGFFFAGGGRFQVSQTASIFVEPRFQYHLVIDEANHTYLPLLFGLVLELSE